MQIGKEESDMILHIENSQESKECLLEQIKVHNKLQGSRSTHKNQLRF